MREEFGDYALLSSEHRDMPGAMSLKRLESLCRRLRTEAAQSGAVFLRDVGHGLLEVSHNVFALLGLALVALLLFGAGRADLRHRAETFAFDWLRDRHGARETVVQQWSDRNSSKLAEPIEPVRQLALELSQPNAIARATASDPTELNRQQNLVAQWLSRRYRVAPEPISRLVQEAWHVGERAGLEPTLILAIMAIESSFNPFAQSSVGAQGLMQVMTKVHDDKYVAFGGKHAAFDPVTNLRVGVQVLKECIARAGSLEAGLRFYVGAANLEEDGGYAGKVLSEQNSLRLVASGKTIPPRTAPAPAPPATMQPVQAQTASIAGRSGPMVAPVATMPSAGSTAAATVEPVAKPEAVAPVVPVDQQQTIEQIVLSR